MFKYNFYNNYDIFLDGNGVINEEEFRASFRRVSSCSSDIKM